MKYCLFFISLFVSSIFLAQNKKKILIVGSNVPVYNQKTNGTFLVEISVPFAYFTNHGYEVDVVTPLGGKTAMYHRGDTNKILKEKALDPRFTQKTTNSLKPPQVRAEDYAAIVFPGGYSHFEDVLNNKEITALAARIYESGGIIGALGHGTADLLNIKLSSGEYFVKGKTLTCFPTWCEKEFMTEADYGKALPVDMQSELEKRGAILKVCTKENQKTSAHLMRVTDKEHRLVTASFADSGEFIAGEIVEMLSH